METIKLTPIPFSPVRKRCRINIQNKDKYQRAKRLENIWTVITLVCAGICCILLALAASSIINIDFGLVAMVPLFIACIGLCMAKYYGVKYWKLREGKVRH
jgi:uncharacterized Tic20 family protein